MKNIHHLIELSIAATFVVLCTSVLSSPTATLDYIVHGEVIIVDDATEETSDEQTTEEATEAVSAESDETLIELFDPMSSEVVISYQTTNDDGEPEEIELGRKSFEDGRFSFHGSTDEPLSLVISIKKDEETTLSANAKLHPGRNINFAFIVGHEGNYFRDEIVLVGEYIESTDTNTVAKVVGDLSDVDEDISVATIYGFGFGFDENGERVGVQIPYVLIHENRFQLDIEVSQPLSFTFYVNSQTSEFHRAVLAILEPGSTVVFNSYTRNGHTFISADGEGRHAVLVESWQDNPKYQEAVVKYQTAYDSWRVASEAGETESDSQSSADEEETNSDEKPITAEIDVDPECEHVAQQEINPPTTYSWRDEYDNMNELKMGALEQIADTGEDATNAFLALSMGAYGYGRNQEAGLAVFEKILARVEDEADLPFGFQEMYDSQARSVKVDRNAAKVVVGKKAPLFKHPDRDGEEITLAGLFSQHDTVLVDFWASWCGPCVAAFPHLKEMYAAYREDGFEILGLSIDQDFDAWIESMDEHELPWTNVGEILPDDDEYRGETTTAFNYGIIGIPTTIWIDSEGCIIGKNLSYDSLETALANRYGEIASDDSEGVE